MSPRLRPWIYSLACMVMLIAPITGQADSPAPPPASPLGLWYTEGQEAVVEITRCANALCGRLVGFKPGEEGAHAVDDLNPDAALRDRPLCNLQFMGGFELRADGTISGGWIYSPRHGAKFSATLRLVEPDKLAVHGYMFIPMLGETQHWTRTVGIKRCAAPPP